MKLFKVVVLFLSILLSFSLFKVKVTYAQINVTDTIYLNGIDGDDNNDGLNTTSAVKSFSKAKQLALDHQNITSILVVGTVILENDVSLEGTNARIVRGSEYTGNLFTVKNNASIELKNITIDGGGEFPQNKQSLINVNKGTLNIKENVVLENNIIINTTNNYTKGGAISVYDGVVNMEGGIIRNNQANYGGAIFLNNSTFNMTGGNIENNRAVRLFDRSVYQYYAAGGGVLLYQGSTMNISDNALIKGNYSAEIGGGISVGGNDWSRPSILNMTNGTIDGNTAGAAGGGIFIQAETGNGFDKAVISGGYIINNVMDGKGRTNKAFGGGGIYVNGMPKQYGGLDWSSGKLYLSNVLISENTARTNGGGIASCPISKTKININDGAVIGNNTVDSISVSSGNDLYILSQRNYGVHGGEPDYDLGSRMFSGALYNWTYDNSRLDNHNTLVLENDLKGTLPSGNSLSLRVASNIDEEIKKLAKVIITNNRSETRGGGIGSNGEIYIGSDEEYKDIEVLKSWENGFEGEEIEIELRAKNNITDWLIESVNLNKNNNFRYIFKNLPKDILKQNSETVIYINEINADKYEATIKEIKEVSSVDTNRKFEIAIENKFAKGSIKIIKVDFTDKTKLLKGVSFELYDLNNKLIASKTTDEKGEIVFEDLIYGKYILKEVKALDGYLKNNEIKNITIDKDNKNIEIEISNKKIPPNPPTNITHLPATGNDSNLFKISLLFIVLGMMISIRYTKN